MGLPNSNLTNWLKARLTCIDVDSEDDEGRNIIRFELYHSVDGEGGARLHSLPVTTPMNVGEASQELYTQAEVDSETRSSGVPQRYIVAAFCESEREPLYTFPFLIRPNPLSAHKLMGQDTEPPTEKGMLSHVMRHDETMHRMMMVMADATAGKLANAVTQKDERIAHLEEQQAKFFEMSQRLLDRTQERELERSLAVQRAKRMDELMGMAMAYTPMVLGAITGKLAPKTMEPLAKSKARDDGIRQLLSNLSEEEAMNVIGAMKPANQAVLIQLFQSYQEDVKKEQASKPEILRDKEQPTAADDKSDEE